MFHQSSKQILLGIFVALLLITMPVYAVKNFKISNYGGANQIWFEAEDFDELDPDDFCQVVDEAGAFGKAVTRGGGSGRVRYTFDISKAGGKGGTWHFWGRVLNPDNRSDYMLVKGHPGDPVIPTGPPYPGGSSAPEFTSGDDQVFEETFTAWGWWGNEDGSDKVLQDGQNTMYIYDRQGNASVFWDVFVWTDSPDYVPTDEDYQNALIFVPGPASNPNPANEAADVPRDVVLSWTPGAFAAPTNGHTVYFSESFNNVNDGIGGIAQSATTYAPAQRLDFDKTYYWRVDEVNGPPDFTVYEGKVWSFTTEPVAYAIGNITATASSSEVAKGPENTINGSGLDDSGLLHGKDADDNMWLSGATGPQPTWIEYEFDNVYKLYEMWVWNSNGSLEPVIGFGSKDVSLEYSANGTDYTTLGTTHEFARAPGTPDYAHNTTVDMGGVAAQYVRLTANSNWGGILPQFGLSEVRFFYIPVYAREPSPDSGATDVSIGTIDAPADVTLGFRAGREAAKHDVYFSDSWKAVTNGTAAVTTVTEAGHGPLSLDLGKIYYWRVDEVNEAETPAMWQGDVWDFTTQEYFVMDDFESYNDLDSTDPESNRIFLTWLDGYDIPTNGSLVGYDVPPFAEQSIIHGGKQSLPLSYDNSGTARYSEAERTLSPAQDWTKHGVKALSLWFHGDPNNAAEQMYVKVNDSKVVYDGDAADIKQASWQQWNVDLASFAVDLRNVTKFSIGFGNETSMTPGGSGVAYFDDIWLNPSRCILSRRSADFAKLDYVEDCVVDNREFEVMAGQWLLEELIPGGAEEIWFEAESADTITSPMEIYDDAAASGGKCIGTTDDVGDSSDSPPPDGIATYNFTVQGGTYKISCRIIIPSGDSFWVRIPGATNLTPGENPDNPGTGWVRWSDPNDSENWYWEDVFSGDHDDAVANWTLPAGAHTLEIARREDGALLDRFVITDNLDLDPVTLSPLAADLNEDKKVDFKDYAILADAWLDEQLWPAP